MNGHEKLLTEIETTRTGWRPACYGVRGRGCELDAAPIFHPWTPTPLRTAKAGAGSLNG